MTSIQAESTSFKSFDRKRKTKNCPGRTIGIDSIFSREFDGLDIFGKETKLGRPRGILDRMGEWGPL